MNPMGLYFVIGTPGTGKTAVCEELRRRGFRAYDTDHDKLSHWEDGTLRLPPETVLRLAAEVGDSAGFICGSVGNEGEVWEHFEGVVSLSVSADVLRRRLIARRGFGSTGDELSSVLASHQTVDADNARFGAHLINADRPVAAVVDEILRVLGVRCRAE
jgi:gluconate kinase